MDLKTQYMAWQFWFGVAQFAVTTLVWIYVWISNRDKARSKDIKAVEDRVTRLESCSISHDDLGKVYDRLNDVSAQVSAMTGTVKGILGSVEMIHQYLLNNGGKS